MSRLQCRGSIAGAAFVLALFSSRPADAQVVVQGPPRQHGGLLSDLVTGVHYDRMNQAHAERRLQHLESKFRRDAGRGDSAAVDRDVCRIDNVRYRIAVDEWLIRKNLLLYPGRYPIRNDAETAAIIADAARPSEDPAVLRPVPTPGPMAAAPTISITIVNAEAAGTDVAFAIDGVAHQAVGDSRQDFAVAPNSHITYDGGGSLGQRRYVISPGVYEFRSTSEGWALYKLPDTP